jgi:hypothetical protein
VNTFGKVIWVIVLSVLLVATATAFANSVKCGDQLRLTLNDGQRLSGQFYGSTADSICILNRAYQWRYQWRESYQWFPKDEIWELEKRKKHTLYGFAFGLAIGAAIGGYIYEAERESAKERFKREQEAYDAWWTYRPGFGGSIYDATSQLRYYPTPPQFEAPSPWLFFGPMIGGAVLGTLIGNSIRTYKSISLNWSVFPLGYCTLPDRTEHNNYSIRFQLCL